MKVVAFLPAKGASERVFNKNTRLIDGKPLFLKTLEKLLECPSIDEVYLDTESETIINLASSLNVKILKRDPSYASNKVNGNELLLNEVKQVEADLYIQILCTSPFIKVSTIEGAIKKLKSQSQYDSAFLVRKEKLYEWVSDGPLYDIDHIPNSKDLPDKVIETMGLYLIRREAALKTKRRIGERPLFLYADAIEAVDVNWPEDFELAALIEAGKRELDQKLLANVKQHLSSPMLSDILDDLGIQGVISGYELNLRNRKIFGRAKTLKLRKLREGEDFRGIYKALESYDTIVPNDIILVENESSEYAYFGELNASLAIRSGAAGAVIGGKTRDSKAVGEMSFPVFSKGYNCKDVRKRATVESINKEIHLEGIPVRVNDLVFGDNEGLIVIPKEYEEEVLKRATHTVSNERNILLNISKGISVESISERFGNF